MLGGEVDGFEVLGRTGRFELVGVRIELVGRRLLAASVHPSDGEPVFVVGKVDPVEIGPGHLPEPVSRGHQTLGGFVPSAVVPAECPVDGYVEALDHALGQDVIGTM